jgi:hypothetical protein
VADEAIALRRARTVLRLQEALLRLAQAKIDRMRAAPVGAFQAEEFEVAEAACLVAKEQRDLAALDVEEAEKVP